MKLGVKGWTLKGVRIRSYSGPNAGKYEPE